MPTVCNCGSSGCNPGSDPGQTTDVIHDQTLDIHATTEAMEKGVYYHMGQVEAQAVANSNAPSASNPFATMADVGSGGGGGGGITYVAHDATLTGLGTPASLLSVVGGGGGLATVTTGPSLSGDGSTTNPLQVAEIYHDDTLEGKGTALFPLSAVALVHDDTLTGTGRLGSPLHAVAEPVIHDGTLTGTGLTGDPLSVVSGETGLQQVYHDDTLGGSGTEVDPLTVVVDETGLLYVTTDDTLTGNGTADDPLSVADIMTEVEHDFTMIGNGTEGSPLSVVGNAPAYYNYNIVGDGTTTSFTITHGLNSPMVGVFVRDTIVGEYVQTDVRFASSNAVTVSFATAPAAGEVYNAFILGPGVQVLAAPASYSTVLVGNGSTTTFLVVHSLNAALVSVVVKEASTNQYVITDIEYVNDSAINIIFGEAPASGSAYNVMVMAPGSIQQSLTPSQLSEVQAMINAYDDLVSYSRVM